MNMEETAPTPSASSNVLGKGFNTLDYILCLSYLALTFYISYRSAFSDSNDNDANDKRNSNKKLTKGSDDEDDNASSSTSLLTKDGNNNNNKRDVVLSDRIDIDPPTSTSNNNNNNNNKKSLSSVKTDAADNYFLAGRGANKLIVAISLLSGLTSGVSFLGVPAYGYENGFGVVLPIFSGQVIASYIIAYLIIPFYSKLRLSTPYTYLERRFDRTVRTVVACLFCFRIIAYMTVVIQAPAILFKATTGVEGWITALICGLFATFFTMKGGMKTVIVTDFMQSLALIGGAILTLILAMAGSKDGLQQEDLKFELKEYLSIQTWGGDNFWYFMIGILFNTVGQSGTDQIAIQRLMSTKDVHSAKKSIIISGWLNGIMSSVFVFMGLYMHAYYRSHNKKPLAGQSTANNIMPYFLMEDSPSGFLGIVIAAVLGCTLSVLSGGLNAVAACFYVDIVQNVFMVVATPEEIVYKSRIITFVFGIIITCLAVLSTYVKIDIVNFSNIASGLFMGPISAVFLLGMLNKRVNTRGVKVGFTCSIFLILYTLAGEITCVGINSGAELPKICNGFLYYARMNAWVVATFLAIPTATIALVVSYMTDAPPDSKLRNLTLFTLTQHSKVTNADKLNRDPENTYGTIVDEGNGISSTTTNDNNEDDMMNSPLIVNQTESINQ